MTSTNSIQWKDYQKEIGDDNYYYSRSCIRQNFFPGSENTFIRILREVLNKNIYDDAEHTCCTGIGYHSDVVPFETLQTVVARNLSLMSEKGYENLAVSCVTSFGIYSEISETWKHFPDEEQKIKNHLKKSTRRELAKPSIMSHASDIIYKFRHEIFKKSKYSLINKDTGEPLRVVEHIGCHYSKMFPEKGVGGAEFPQVLAGMITAWGGAVVDYPERRHCCGFGFRQYLIKANRGYSLSNSIKKFESMKPYKPDFIVANCPGCSMFLDKWQYTAKKLTGETYGQNGEQIPVLTYEEMAGLVLGFNPWDLGLQMHQVDCEPLLKKMHYGYNLEDKYKGMNGKVIGEMAEGESKVEIKL